MVVTDAKMNPTLCNQDSGGILFFLRRRAKVYTSIKVYGPENKTIDRLGG